MATQTRGWATPACELCGARRGAPPAEEAQSRALAQEVGRPRTTAFLPLRRCYVVRETDQ